MDEHSRPQCQDDRNRIDAGQDWRIEAEPTRTISVVAIIAIVAEDCVQCEPHRLVENDTTAAPLILGGT
jgi:hypothetical protein